MSWLRHPRTTQELRNAQGVVAELREDVELGVCIRPRRGVSKGSLANVRDDKLPASRKDKSWKKSRKTKWRNG